MWVFIEKDMKQSIAVVALGLNYWKKNKRGSGSNSRKMERWHGAVEDMMEEE